jgi:molecular chaperone GrpE
MGSPEHDTVFRTDPEVSQSDPGAAPAPDAATRASAADAPKESPGGRDTPPVAESPAPALVEQAPDASEADAGPVDESTDHERSLERDLAELEAKAQKADEYLELAQRTRADFENFRKRAAREAAAAQERGIAKLAKELLPAVDSLDRARAV